MESQAPQTFEDIKARLDEIVAAVSDEELPLDEALSLYEEAVGIGLTASRIVEEGIAAKEPESAEAQVSSDSGTSSSDE